MGSGQLAAPLEAQLLGLKVGEHRTFVLQPEQAFGPRNPELIQKVSRTLLAAESSADAHYQPGDVVEFRKSPQGLPDQRVAAVLQELNDQYALFDFNHPLAGQTVSFEVKIVGVL
jgi:FKBP-type peptidyl-prolyl cis-trans isomerase SlpA